MHHRSRTLVGLSVAAATLVGLSSQRADARTSQPAACTITAAQDLMVRGGEQELRVTVSEDIVDGATASFAPESKLRVVSVTKDTAARTLKVNTDASAAMAGSWTLTISAAEKSCKGDVKVVAGTPTDTL